MSTPSEYIARRYVILPTKALSKNSPIWPTRWSLATFAASFSPSTALTSKPPHESELAILLTHAATQTPFWYKNQKVSSAGILVTPTEIASRSVCGPTLSALYATPVSTDEKYALRRRRRGLSATIAPLIEITLGNPA